MESAGEDEGEYAMLLDRDEGSGRGNRLNAPSNVCSFACWCRILCLRVEIWLRICTEGRRHQRRSSWRTVQSISYLDCPSHRSTRRMRPTGLVRVRRVSDSHMKQQTTLESAYAQVLQVAQRKKTLPRVDRQRTLLQAAVRRLTPLHVLRILSTNEYPL